jgi:HYDIN/CFA65/VesB family protein
LTIEAVDLPDAPFSVADPPQPGDVIAGGDAITLAVTFAPTAIGAEADELELETTGGDEAVGLSGVGAPPPRLTLSSLALDFGTVPLGRSTTRGFTLTNTGGSTLTITKSKPPSRGRFVALTDLAESTTLAPGDSLREIVRFTPASLTATNDGWTITGDDGSGLQVVSFTGRGTPPAPGDHSPPRTQPPATQPPPRVSHVGLRRLRELPHRPIPGG